MAIYHDRVAGYEILYAHIRGARSVIVISCQAFWSFGKWALLWGDRISKQSNDRGIPLNLAQFGFGYEPKNLKYTSFPECERPIYYAPQLLIP